MIGEILGRRFTPLDFGYFDRVGTAESAHNVNINRPCYLVQVLVQVFYLTVKEISGRDVIS